MHRQIAGSSHAFDESLDDARNDAVDDWPSGASESPPNRQLASVVKPRRRSVDDHQSRISEEPEPQSFLHSVEMHIQGAIWL